MDNLGKLNPQKVVVVGAGPVGALAALYAAKRGDEVHVYELRDGKRPIFKYLDLLSNLCFTPSQLQGPSHLLPINSRRLPVLTFLSVLSRKKRIFALKMREKEADVLSQVRDRILKGTPH